MAIKQKSVGFCEERHFPFFDENKISTDFYIRNLIDEDIRKKNQFKFLPSTPAKESNFIDLVQLYPCPNKGTHLFLPEGSGFWKNKLVPDFSVLVFGFEENFRKEFVKYATKCFEEHRPFGYQDCINDFKNKKFISFDNYSSLKNFRWVDGILRFKFKNAYEFKDSPEAEARKKAEFEKGEIQRQNERNALDKPKRRINIMGGKKWKKI